MNLLCDLTTVNFRHGYAVAPNNLGAVVEETIVVGTAREAATVGGRTGPGQIIKSTTAQVLADLQDQVSDGL